MVYGPCSQHLWICQRGLSERHRRRETAAGTAAPTKRCQDQRVVRERRSPPAPAHRPSSASMTYTVVLNENSEFRVNQYIFDKDKPRRQHCDANQGRNALGERPIASGTGPRLLCSAAAISKRGTDFSRAGQPGLSLSLVRKVRLTNAAGSVALRPATHNRGIGPTLAVAISVAARPPWRRPSTTARSPSVRRVQVRPPVRRPAGYRRHGPASAPLSAWLPRRRPRRGRHPGTTTTTTTDHYEEIDRSGQDAPRQSIGSCSQRTDVGGQAPKKGEAPFTHTASSPPPRTRWSRL